MGDRRSKCMRLALGGAALGILALFALFLYSSCKKEGEAKRILPPRSPGAAKVEAFRSLPFESLLELSFDEALTVLGSEVERFHREPGACSRIERRAARLEELYQGNLDRIDKASHHYDSGSPGILVRFAAFCAEHQRRYDTLRGLAALRGGDGAARLEILNLPLSNAVEGEKERHRMPA